MNYWIFQAVPGRYDLREKLIAGQNETWYATRYRSLMFPGDVVFFWLAGEEEIRGIYGWGKLASQPYDKPEWDSYGVDVQYAQRLESHLSARSILATPDLSGLLIFRAPQATNFLITLAEARTIAVMMPSSARPEGLLT